MVQAINDSKQIHEGLLAPISNWSEMGDSEHFVQFYEADAFLLNSLWSLTWRCRMKTAMRSSLRSERWTRRGQADSDRGLDRLRPCRRPRARSFGRLQYVCPEARRAAGVNHGDCESSRVRRGQLSPLINARKFARSSSIFSQQGFEWEFTCRRFDSGEPSSSSRKLRAAL